MRLAPQSPPLVRLGGRSTVGSGGWTPYSFWVTYLVCLWRGTAWFGSDFRSAARFSNRCQLGANAWLQNDDVEAPNDLTSDRRVTDAVLM